MPPKGFKCKQCGNCCLNLSGAIEVCATDEDLRRWEENGRFDILEWVDAIYVGDGHYVYDIWINPRTGDDVARCPWLRKLPNQDKYICRIHDMKPEHCREYPLSREHAEKTGCRGFGGTMRKKRDKGNEVPKADADSYKARIETFFHSKGVSVTVRKNKGGYSIFSGAGNTPTARLRFTDKKDMVEVLWWSHREKWESIGDFGGVFMPFDDALKYIDEDQLGCFWTYSF